MNGSVAPSLVEETACPIQVVEVLLVRPASPKLHVANLKVRPEMTRRISVGLEVVLGPSRAVCHPVHRVVRMQVLVVVGDELGGLGPQGRNALRAVVQVDGEAVCLVVVLHPGEDVIIDIAEEADVGLDAPIVAGVEQGGMLVEQTTVPTAHLVVGLLAHVLHVLLREHGDGFLVDVFVDPAGDGPVFLRYDLYRTALSEKNVFL